MKSGDSKKKALVVAISKYNDDLLDDLDFCENDGHAMYEVLNDAGYEILENNKIIGNVSKKALENSIVEFFRKNVNPSDTLLFYFTGHGYTDEHGDGFFCTSDIDIKVPDLNGVFFSNLTKQMDKTDSQRIIAILDCCHSGSTLQSDIGRVMGPTEKEAKAIKDGRASLEKEFVHGQGRCILASSLSNKSSYGMEGQPYSAFTYYILEGLKQNKETVDEEGHVTPEKLSMYVSEQLKKLQGENYQKPVRHISFTGKLVIAEYNNLKQKTSSALTDKQVDELLQTDDINEMKKQLRILLGKQQEILEKTPEKSDGNQVLDEKFQELKMKKEVLREKLEKLGETPEVNVRYSLQEAELQLQLGNIPEANKLLNDVLKVNSHDENAKAFKEQIYDEIKRKAKAKDKKTWKNKNIDIESLSNTIVAIFKKTQGFNYVEKYHNPEGSWYDIQAAKSGRYMALTFWSSIISSYHIILEKRSDELSVFITSGHLSTTRKIGFGVLGLGVNILSSKLEFKVYKRHLWKQIEKEMLGEQVDS